MHDKLVAELSQMKKLYLLFESMTTPQNASDSELLYKAFWDKFSGKALSPFAGQAHEFLNKGIEMYRVLLGIDAPVDQSTLLSLSTKLNDIKMSKTEDIINFVKRIRIVNQGLIANGQSWPESFLVLTAIRGLDVKRYREFLKSFHTGVISVPTLNSLIAAVNKFEGLSSVIPTDGSSGSTSTSGALLGTANNTTNPAPAPAPVPAPTTSPSTCDKFSGADWSLNDAPKLMDKFQCFICRKDEHKWPKFPMLKYWNISKKDGHPRPNETKPDSTAATSPASSTPGTRLGKGSHVTSADVPPPPPPDDSVDAKSVTFEDLTNANPFSQTGDESGTVDSSSLLKGKVSNVYLSSSSDLHNSLPSTLCVVGSGASRHMCNNRQAFVSFTPTPNAFVEVTDGAPALCIGIGNAVFYMRDKLVLLSDVLCVPSLTNCLFAVSRHRRSKIKDCGFISLNEDTYIQFPSFRILVDDDEECTVPVRFPPSVDNLPPLEMSLLLPLFWVMSRLPLPLYLNQMILTRMTKTLLPLSRFLMLPLSVPSQLPLRPVIGLPSLFIINNFQATLIKLDSLPTNYISSWVIAV